MRNYDQIKLLFPVELHKVLSRVKNSSSSIKIVEEGVPLFERSFFLNLPCIACFHYVELLLYNSFDGKLFVRVHLSRKKRFIL